MTVPKLVLYNADRCPFAARAVIALAETKAEHEVVNIDLDVPRPEWYLKDINPYGQVPALKIDDKAIILESLIVAEYVANLHPESGLVPTDPLQLAQIRYLIHHWSARVQPVQNKAAFTLDPVVSSKAREDLIVELEKFNKLLLNAHRKETDITEGGHYFLGDKFTLAEVNLGSFLGRLFLLGQFNDNKPVTVEEYPQLERFFQWKDAVLKRPSVQKSLPSKESLIATHAKYAK